MHQFLVRSVRCQSHATEMVAQRAPRMYFGAPKAPRGSISESRNSPKRSRRAPGCTPAHRCGPGFPQTRLKSLRSEPGHGFPPLLGHLGDQPSLPAQCPYTVEDPLSLHPFASTAPHASPGSADTRWPAATAADPFGALSAFRADPGRTRTFSGPFPAHLPSPPAQPSPPVPLRPAHLPRSRQNTPRAPCGVGGFECWLGR